MKGNLRFLLGFAVVAALSGMAMEATAQQRYSQTQQTGQLVFRTGYVELWLGAQTPLQAALYTGEGALLEEGDLAQEEGFRLRRTRIKLGGQLTDWLEFALSTELKDFEDSGGTVVDAWASFQPIRYFGFKAGAQELPWTRSTLISSTYQSGVDRPLGVRGMAPRRPPGAIFFTNVWKDRIQLQGGVFNTLMRNEGFFGGYDEVGGSSGNLYSRFTYVARLDFDPLGTLDPSVPDIEKNRKPRVNLGAGYFYNDGASHKIHAYAADLQVKWMGVALLTGYLRDSISPTLKPNQVGAVEDDKDRLAWFVEADYTILKRLLGLHARYEWIDVNRDALDADDQAAMTVGANLYAVDHLVKFQVEFQHRFEREAQDVENDTLLTQLQISF